MLRTTDPGTAVREAIRELLAEAGTPVGDLAGPEQLHELGLTSLLLARLVIELEERLGVDPFADQAEVFDARTVDALVAVYRRALAPAEEVETSAR